MRNKTILVTGGAGFIGSAVVRRLLRATNYQVVVLDKFTYAGNIESFGENASSERLTTVRGDIADRKLVADLLNAHRPQGIMNLAAESHVDRSIDGPSDFIQTNIVGTFNMLEASLKYWQSIDNDPSFRFQHISTDEVYGSLGDTGLFTELSRYEPNSPYSASKASSDHLVRAWHETYKLPTLLTNCSNNYGPYHYPEKLIPLIILNALQGKSLPVYGDGKQIRDWLFVDDHVNALLTVYEKGKPGHTYNVGGDSEKTNIEVVQQICTLLDELAPSSKHKPHFKLVKFVTDRPGHDRRYAIDCSKIKNELGWKQEETFNSGLRKTVEWFLANDDWVKAVLKNKYDGERLGVVK